MFEIQIRPRSVCQGVTYSILSEAMSEITDTLYAYYQKLRWIFIDSFLYNLDILNRQICDLEKPHTTHTTMKMSLKCCTYVVKCSMYVVNVCSKM